MLQEKIIAAGEKFFVSMPRNIFLASENISVEDLVEALLLGEKISCCLVGPRCESM